jgi:hypothetical protein
MRRTITAIMLLGALSVTGCATDGQAAGGPATPPIAAPTPVTSVTQSAPTRSPQQSSPVATPTHHVAPRNSSTHTTAPTCGAPANPYGFNLCGRGSKVHNPPADVCNYFDCIPNFSNGRGYMVQCNDSMFSMSGGLRGTCSYHNGERKAVFKG